ncbi:MAG: galactose-1-phosphate uridylyltransferase [Candidatus Zixiibacteriota bacterium]|nr:MAG: galactose-1-phosphate uridylyltransferase [candidate division Zixibacteria bacterium]
MPEFRQNLATKEWIILAPERGKRPSDMIQNRASLSAYPQFQDDCPFCPGNEGQTEEPVLTCQRDGDWQVRVVPNKYAALQPHLATTRTWVGTFLAAKGFGIAEVVVEHPRHNTTPALMELEEVANMLRAYRQRQVEISKNEKINLVTIFRNHGVQAGTSLVHPHSQIIATPIVPPHVRFPMEQAVMHYDKYGTCVYCDMVGEELRQGERILVESDNFIAVCPFAARSPFECRIYPKKHQASFTLLNDNEEIVELAWVLREILGKLYHGLGNPDYNYVIRSSPIGDEDTRHLHWYIVIIPKITIPAGFEIGSGIYINTLAPEEAARFLRDIKAER